VNSHVHAQYEKGEDGNSSGENDMLEVEKKTKKAKLKFTKKSSGLHIGGRQS
jgi:hypothetical protein